MPLFAGYNHKKFYKKRRPKSGRLFLCLRDLAFIKIPILLIFCPYFPLQLWLHSSLCARRCNKNYKQKTLRNIGTSIFAKSLSIIFISVLVPVKDSYALCKKLPIAEVVQYQHVYDGDTILLKDGRKVRLIGINAPEIGRKGKASQAFAQKSKHKLKQLLSTSPIINLSYDLEKKDRYNRSLAYIYLPDGTDVQAEILLSGLAISIVIMPNEKNLSCYRAIEKKARNKQKGIWQNIVLKERDSIDLSNKLQKYQFVKGKVVSLKLKSKMMIIELDNNLSVKLSGKAFFAYKKQDLLGKKIKVRGIIYPFRKKSGMSISHPANITTLVGY